MSVTVATVLTQLNENNNKLRESSLSLVENKLLSLYRMQIDWNLFDPSISPMHFQSGLLDVLAKLQEKGYKPSTKKSFLQAILYGMTAMQSKDENKEIINMEIEKLKAEGELQSILHKSEVDTIWNLQRCDEILQLANQQKDDSLYAFRDYLLYRLHYEVPLREESSILHYFDDMLDANQALQQKKNVIYVGEKDAFVHLVQSKTSAKYAYARMYLSAKLFDELCIFIAMSRPQKGNLFFGTGKVPIRSTGSCLTAICNRFFKAHPVGGVCNWLRRMHAARAALQNRSVEVARQLGHSAATHAKVYLTQSIEDGSA